MASRRGLLQGAVLLLGGYLIVRGAAALWRGPAALEFEPLARPAGFRRLDAGAVSAPFDPLIGLEASAPILPGPRIPPEAVEARLCAWLFEGAGTAPAPIASFSDYACPYCRVLTPRLAALEAAGTPVAWHEWPLLGPDSVLAARAALAAKRQGAYAAYHARLMGGRGRPTEAGLLALATELGLDAGRLRADMRGPEVAAEIARADAMARLFAAIGTPLIVVGRTAVEGAIDEATLAQLIDLEREAGPVPGC